MVYSRSAPRWLTGSYPPESGLGWPTGKASGRMHHHDKYAATKDGHRPDDPHGVTGVKREWTEQETDAMMAEQRASGIRREGHEVYDDTVDYGQRVSAFGNVERNIADQQIDAWHDRPRPDAWSGSRPIYYPSEGYSLEGDEAVDVMEGEEDQTFAKKAMYGQDYTYSKERRQHEAQTGTSLGRLAKPGAGDKEWEQTVARAR